MNLSDNYSERLVREFNDFRSEFWAAKRIRLVENSLLELFAQGKLTGTVHTCVGQELIPVVLSKYWDSEKDFVVSNHRGHGHFLAFTGDVRGLVSEVLGKVEGVSGGYGGSQHLVAKRFLANGIQGGMTPVAVGLASELRRLGGVAFCFIGDGTLGEGVFYEALNLAAKWECPVLFVLEDNGISQSTDQRQVLSGSVEGRALAFDLGFFSTNTWDIRALSSVSAEACEYVRLGRPALLHIKTARLNSHSKGDDNRDGVLVENLRADDLLNVVERQGLLDSVTLAKYEQELAGIVENAVAGLALTSVQRFSSVSTGPSPTYLRYVPENQSKVVDEITSGLSRCLTRWPELEIIGEDIQDTTEFCPRVYGGAFKVTKSLSTRFPGRVKNTPISEAAIVGYGIGRAVLGKPTIVEIMFGDFCTLIVDQVLQHAAKFPTMFGKLNFAPLLIRTPMGGRRGYGPTHSSSIERLFFGHQNLLVWSPNHRVNIPALYEASLAGCGGAVLVVENKVMYTLKTDEPIPPGYRGDLTAEAFPVFRLTPARFKARCTIVTYGYGLALAESAVRVLLSEHELFVDVICLSKLSPLDCSAICESLRATGRLVTLEEGGGYGGLGSEVIAHVVAQGIVIKKVMKLGNETIIPCSAVAERWLLPSADDVVNAVLEVSS
jgi:2-oxoisovalerate dehydrogenase E1 component